MNWIQQHPFLTVLIVVGIIVLFYLATRKPKVVINAPVIEPPLPPVVNPAARSIRSFIVAGMPTNPGNGGTPGANGRGANPRNG